MPRTIVGPHRVKAHKPHACDWCLGRIEVGEEYTTSTLAGDWFIYTWCECDICAPYVAEMRRYYKNDASKLDTYHFSEFMLDEHPDVFKKWLADKREDD